jgi:hypothetical protein
LQVKTVKNKLMIFTSKQVESLLSIIDFSTSVFVTTQMGENVLSTYDKYILNKFGFDIDKIKAKYPPFLQSFLFGRLTGWLSDNQASQIAYNDFEKHLKSGQYFPLTKKEQTLYDISINRSYDHIKNLASKRKDELKRMISEEDVRNEISEAISKRKSIQNIVSEWGTKTGDWQRDYGRIAETEMNTIFQLGRATQIEERYAKDQKVYKQVFEGSCRHCIRLYLTGGIGSQPRIFTLQELQENGTNIGLKVADWKPIVGSTHPYCRCNLQFLPKGQTWDKEKKDFVYPEKYEQVIKRTQKNKLTVGDKVFWV